MFQGPPGTYPYIIKSGDSLWRIAQQFGTTIQAIAAANPMLDEDNLQIGQVIFIPQKYGYHQKFIQSYSNCISAEEQRLHDQFRLLWEQHVYWTRMAIVSILMSLPDEEYVSNRLLRNPKDFEVALRPYYGEINSQKFEELLTSHLSIAAELVKALKAGNNIAAADADKRWYANADQIAEFLGSINPYWSVQEWKKMLYDHLSMTKEEAAAIMDKRFEDSIYIFDAIEKEALMMADTMTQGIVEQFSS